MKNLFYILLLIIGLSTNAITDLSFVDPDREVPQGLLNEALNFYQSNYDSIKNKNYIGIINFSEHNSKERFYIINMLTGHVEKYLVAHGKNTDPLHTGTAKYFSNENNSKKSSLGFYFGNEVYEGIHGESLRLDGLSPTNSNARQRAIVIHPADYVAPGDKIGRSFGCPSVEPRYSHQIIEYLKDGALIYANTTN